jgi:hypothetical protein
MDDVERWIEVRSLEINTTTLTIEEEVQSLITLIQAML